MHNLPDEVEVVVEVPKGSFLKRGYDGTLDYISPMPAPFNYGSIPAIEAADGDPLDAVLVGPRRPAGHRQTATVMGIVHFIDAGDVDEKVVCGTGRLRTRDWLLINAFFAGYAVFKGSLNLLRGKNGKTRYRGGELIR